MRIVYIPSKGPVIFHAFRGLPYTPLNTICECCDDFRAELVIFGDRRNQLNFVDEYHVAPCFPDKYFICRECSIKYRCYRPDIDEIEHAFLVYAAAQKKLKRSAIQIGPEELIPNPLKRRKTGLLEEEPAAHEDVSDGVWRWTLMRVWRETLMSVWRETVMRVWRGQ